MRSIALATIAFLAVTPVPLTGSHGPGVTIIDLMEAPTVDEVTPDEATETEPAPQQELETSEPTPRQEHDNDQPRVEGDEELLDEQNDDAPVNEETETEAPPALEEQEPQESEPPALEEEGDETIVAPASMATSPFFSFAQELSDDDFDLVTAPLETDGFHVAGITWTAGAVERVDIRSLAGGTWSDWYTLELDTEGQPGTEPYIAGGSNGLQVRASWTSQPTDFRVSLMDGEGDLTAESHEEGEVADALPPEGTEIEQSANADEVVEPAFFVPPSTDVTVQPASVTTPVATQNEDIPAPAITSRAQWGVEELTPRWKVTQSNLKGAIVHHTAGTNNYTRAQSPGIVRSIWRFHTIDRGWGDIGYNFLVDKYGRVYEGRSGTLTAPAGKMAIGAHAAPANTGSVGISVMGNYTGSVTPSQTVLNKLETVLAWQFARSGVNATGTRTYTDQAGVTRTIPTIAGHRDVSATVCPGNIYPTLAQLRRDVKAEADKLKEDLEPVVFADIAVNYSTMIGRGWPPQGAYGAGDFNRNGYADLMLRTASGDLILYPGAAGDWVQPGRKIGHGWSGISTMLTGTDFDGDGNTDIVAVDATGRLLLYPGNGRGGFQRMRQIGHNWQNFDHLWVVEDGPGGKPTVYGVLPNGRIISYVTNGSGRITQTRDVRGKANHYRSVVPVGDWNQDGYTDLVSTDSNGILYFHRALGDGTFADRARFGHGWQNFTHILPRDTNGRVGRFFGTTRSGQLYTYSFRYTG